MEDRVIGFAMLDRGLVFYRSSAHACSYLPGRSAATLFADPATLKTSALYGQLIRQGFRRSGEEIYRPHCPGCQACIPVRISVESFRPNRAQRRTWVRNQDLQIRTVTPAYRPEHFELYRRYISARHGGGGMDHDDRAAFLGFLTAPFVETVFYEFRLAGALLAVAVVDHLEDALSAVYTFYDPNRPQRSLGRHAILYAIETARSLGLCWLYLGYWIRDCRKMHYKDEFQPLEAYLAGRWQILARGESCSA